MLQFQPNVCRSVHFPFKTSSQITAPHPTGVYFFVSALINTFELSGVLKMNFNNTQQRNG